MEELKQQCANVEHAISSNAILFEKGQEKIDQLKQKAEDLRNVPSPVFTPPPKPVTPGDPKVLKKLGAQLAKVLKETKALPKMFEQEEKEIQQVVRSNTSMAKKLSTYLGSSLANTGDVLASILFKPKAAIT